MKLFRRNNNWLKHRVKNKVKKAHPTIFKSSWIKKLSEFKNYLFHKKRWWLIFLIVAFCFSIAFLVGLIGLNFCLISQETARIIVDHRITDIAAITAITFVVIGFLINNLALKDSFIFGLLFKYTYLYPIIYFILSVIGCFIILSTLRDIINPLSFNNMVFIGTVCALFILFLIGFLFRTIIGFSSKNRLWELLNKELILEATSKLRIDLIQNYGSEEYKKIFNAVNSKKRDWIDSFYMMENIEKNENPKKSFLLDVNLKKIEKSVKGYSKNEIIYNNLAFYQNIYGNNKFTFWIEGNKDEEREEKNLKNVLILKKPRKLPSENNDVREYFDKQLKYFVSKNDYNGLQFILNGYLQVYELFIKHSKSLQFELESNIIYGIPGKIGQALNTSIKNSYQEAFLEIDKFIFSVIFKSIQERSLKVYKEYIFCYVTYYQIAYDYKTKDEKYNEIYKNCTDKALSHLKSFGAFDLNFDKHSDAEDYQKLVTFSSYVFHSFSQLLYFSLKDKNQAFFQDTLNNIKSVINISRCREIKQNTKFQLIMKSNDKIEETKKLLVAATQYTKYARHTLFGIKYWMLFLYKNGKINLNQKEIKSVGTIGFNPEEVVKDLFFFVDLDSKLDEYFDWRNWHISDYSDSKGTREIVTPLDWLTFGFFVNFIINNENIAFLRLRDHTGIKKKDIDLLTKKFNDHLNYLENNFDRWEKLLGLSRTNILKQRGNKIISTFESNINN